MLVITDGVFGADGDIAPIPEIVKVADEFGVMVMVDDAAKSSRGQRKESLAASTCRAG